jgi:hypothetical protein
MRQNARMATGRVRTANYSDSARTQLGEAVLKAREALGMSRPQLITAAAKAGVTLNKKSLELVETGQPGVGQSFLYALGRFLPNWTEDTAKAILEGGTPPTADSADGSVKTEHLSAARRRLVEMTAEELVARVLELAEAVGQKAAADFLQNAMEIRREAHQRT